MKNENPKKKNRDAFIMIEVLVSISILLLCVPSAYNAIQSGTTGARYAKDQLIATYLAQEGLEIIESRRGDNMISLSNGGAASGWLDGIDPECTGVNGCSVDIGYRQTEPTITPCAGPICGRLNVNDIGVFAYNTGAGWTTTKYSRVVHVTRISCVGCPDAATVDSSVSYDLPNIGTRTVTISEDKYYWLAPAI